MKKLNNGYADYYYLTEEGTIYNESEDRYILPDKRHQFKLKTINNTHKTVALKTLYKLIYNKPYCNDHIESLDGEIWKVIEDTEGSYYVSSYGRIKSYSGYNAILLKPYPIQHGYLRVDISLNGQRHSKLVHRIVAAHFLPMPKHIDDQLHHIDGNNASNLASNLIWLSPNKHRMAHSQLNNEEKNNVST